MQVPDPAAYESYAETFARHAETSAHNAHYDRPVVLDLLGDVRGLRVLDAGCGPGLLAAELQARGAASVVGVDASPTLVRLARERLGPDADVRVHDLTEALDWLPDGSVEWVVCALVLHHLADPRPMLREFGRVLAPGGRLVVSTVHPTSDWLRLGGSYFADELVTEHWSSFGTEVTFRRAPLEALCADFFAAGFLIERHVEHRPAASMEVDHTDDHDQLTREPAFIAFRLVPALP